jgi:hypothetical protein
MGAFWGGGTDMKLQWNFHPSMLLRFAQDALRFARVALRFAQAALRFARVALRFARAALRFAQEPPEQIVRRFPSPL